MISKHGEKGNESTLQVKKHITPTSHFDIFINSGGNIYR